MKHQKIKDVCEKDMNNSHAYHLILKVKKKKKKKTF